MSDTRRVINVLSNYVVVRQKLPDGVTRDGGDIKKGNIILATSDNLSGNALEEFEGYVMAVGPLVDDIKKGELVSFTKYAFSTKYWGGKEYFILTDNLITAVERDTDEKPKNLKESEFIAGDENE